MSFPIDPSHYTVVDFADVPADTVAGYATGAPRSRPSGSPRGPTGRCWAATSAPATSSSTCRGTSTPPPCSSGATSTAFASCNASIEVWDPYAGIGRSSHPRSARCTPGTWSCGTRSTAGATTMADRGPRPRRQPGPRLPLHQAGAARHRRRACLERTTAVRRARRARPRRAQQRAWNFDSPRGARREGRSTSPSATPRSASARSGRTSSSTRGRSRGSTRRASPRPSWAGAPTRRRCRRRPRPSTRAPATRSASPTRAAARGCARGCRAGRSSAWSSATARPSRSPST